MEENKILEKGLAFLSLFFFSVSLCAQITFTQDDHNYPAANHVLGIADLNGDFRDDLIIYSAPRDVSLYVQTINKHLVLANKVSLGNGLDWTFMMGDYENTGLKSFVSSGAYNGTKKMDINSLQSFENTQSTVSGGFLFAQGSNSIDIDDDGYLDLFICNDDGDSFVMINDQSGSFEKRTDFIDFTTIPSSDGSGNYASIWSYIDGDDKLDLYIAKCRLGSVSTEDPKRINQVYLKNESGSFTRSSSLGLDIGWQSWTADFGDMDNDGDLDVFITNHDHHHMLMENINNQSYQEVESFAAMNVIGQDIQGILEDFDNDGYLDILLVGENNTILWNTGNLQFERTDNVLDTPGAFSAATGDLNSDGAIDVIASYPIGTPANFDRPSHVYYNNSNENNFLCLSLFGTNSNREAVGARVVCHSDLGKQTRVISSGEGYGIVNSLSVRFGLSTDQVVDSLVVMWPNGVYETYIDIAVNKHFVLTEGTSCLKSIETSFENEIRDLCPNENVTVSLSDSEAHVFWQNDQQSEGSDLTVSEAGFYSAIMFDSLTQCYNASPTAYIELIESEPTPLLSLNANVFCEGEVVQLSAPESLLYWSTGDTINPLEVTTSGTYQYVAQGLCQALESESLTLEFISTVDLDDRVIPFDPDTDPVIDLDDTYDYEWSFDEDCETILGTGSQIELTDLISDTTLYVRSVTQSEAEFGIAGLLIESTGNGFGLNSINPGMAFDVFDDAKLVSVKVRTDLPGERLFTIHDKTGLLVYSSSVQVESGVNLIEINADLVEDEDYVLATDVSVNLMNLGTNSPGFSRTSSNVVYPYSLDNYVSITGNDLGDDNYYYFYDWTFEKQGISCYGNKANFFFDMNGSGTAANQFQQIHVYPNPVSNKLFISNITTPTFYSIKDVNGNLIINNQTLIKDEIPLEYLPSGIYIIELQQDQNMISKRFIKI